MSNISNLSHQVISKLIISFKLKPEISVKIISKYLNISSDDHQFSPLHWASKGGHMKIVEMLISRGARVHTTNMGDDTPLHLASAHGHREVVQMVSPH